MTPIEKSVTRVTRGGLGFGYGPDRGRPLACTLAQGDLLVMRAKGTRRAYTLSLFDLYALAIRREVNMSRLEKANAAKARKAAAREKRRQDAATRKLHSQL